jgi:hypothetical protein
MKKYSTCLIITLLSVFSCLSQNFRITAKVIGEQNKSVEYVEAMLIQNSAVIQSQLTDSAGVFTFFPEVGNYTLYIRQLGDTLYYQDISLTENLDLGTLKTKQKSKALQEVTVTAKQNLIERKADRMVFNASNLPSTDGGDVIDILKLTPSLTVSDNSISIVGKGATGVMINDRIVELSGDELMNFLKGVRSGDVQSIEVITTPPAKYEAEGNFGLINIVLKKTAQNTWNSSLFGAYLQTKYAYGNVGGSFNYRKNALSFYANIAYGAGNGNGGDEGTIFYPTLKWESLNKYKYNYNSPNTRVGFDLDITDKWTAGAQYMGVFSQPKPATSHEVTNIFNISDNSDAGNIVTEGNTGAKSNTNSVNIHSVIKLDSLGKKINFDFDLLTYDIRSSNTYASTTSGSQDAEIPNEFVSHSNLLNRKISNYSTKIDMEHPIKSVNLNYGAKLSFSKTDNDIQAFNLSAGTAANDRNLTNLFLYSENTQALYVSANTQFGGGKWLAQAGLRGENTQFEGNSVTIDSVFKKSYFELFPTAYLSYNKDEKNVFYAEYGRRISRPGFSQLNPFRSYTNPYYYFAGNPELKPTFSDNVQLGYTYNNIFYIQAFFVANKDNTGNAIVLPDKDGYTQIGTRLNYLDDYNGGIGTAYIFNKLNWWFSQNVVSVWYDRANSKIYPLTPKTMEGYGGHFQTYNVFNLNRAQTVSSGFDFTYASPQSEILTRTYRKLLLNAFFKLLFLNKTLAVTLTGSNLLNDYSFNRKAERSGITVYSKGYYNPLSVRLSVSYSFGSSNVNVQQRKASNEDEQNRVD